MKKKNLFDRWLDHSLSEEERASLQNDERFRAYETITQAAQNFRSPEFDASSSYDRLLSKLNTKNKKSSWKVYAASIAALFIIGFLTFTTLWIDEPSHFSTHIGQKLAIELPNKSNIRLNATAVLAYDKKSWEKERNVNLAGEAFFEVTAGPPFTVKTSNAIIKATESNFNIAQHLNYLTVSCYKGSLEVQIANMHYTLGEGEQLSLINTRLTKDKLVATNPSWIENKSYFKSTPLHFILDELSRQYELDLVTDSIDKSVIFTGSFTHQNLETALQSIAIPLKLSYTIEGKMVRLVKED